MIQSAMRFRDVKESIFATMTRLAQEKCALNFAQGFPDFNGPEYLVHRMQMHLNTCPNQYTRSAGHEALIHAIADYYQHQLPRTYDPIHEITVVNGATEGILCAIVGLVDPGKRILVFEPYYESYQSCAKIAGADLVGVPLLPPRYEDEYEQGLWHIDWEIFEHTMNNNIGLIMLNHPHNPTGKVFKADELHKIFVRAKKLNIPIVIDGVYENLVYAPLNTSFKQFLGEFSDQIIYISSISKTFSFTGFKVGWVLAPKAYTRAIRTVHEAAVFCQPPHMQLAIADILQQKDFLKTYLNKFHADFLKKRNHMRAILKEFGFYVPKAQGSYFLMAKKNKAPLLGSLDQDMAMELLDKYSIASIPVSGFYSGAVVLHDWLRFAFCKRNETIEALSKALNNNYF